MSIQIHLLSSNWCAEYQNLKDIYNITKNIFVIMNNDVYIYSCGMTIYEESVENFQVEFGDRWSSIALWNKSIWFSNELWKYR